MPLPSTFEVSVTDLATRREMDLTVTRSADVQSQEDAEIHVATQPSSHGGTHPGLKVAPKNPEAFAARAAELGVKLKDESEKK